MKKISSFFFIFFFLFCSLSFSQEKEEYSLLSQDESVMKASKEKEEEKEEEEGEKEKEIDEEDVVGEASKVRSRVEKYFLDSIGRLKIFDYDEGSFSLTENVDSFESITVNEDEFSRTKYDETYRPIEKIVWKNATSLSESKILYRKKWQYIEDEIFSLEEDFEAKKFYEIRYNKKELPLETKEYDYDEDENDETKKVLVKKSFMSYDEEKHPLTVEEEFFKKRNGEVEEDPIYTRKTVYSYTEKSESPDILFYEDGVFRFYLEHIDEQSCIETVYFSNGVYVSSKYEDGIKTEEKIYKKDEEK